MNSFKKFSEDKLPDKCEFFSSLKDKCVSEKDYQRAKNVWNVFKMKTMGDYHDIYLKTDALLLADVFEKLIKTCLDYYGLVPCHYFSSPGLSWEAMLKMTRIELEVISDIDIYLFIGKGMRGGLSYIAKIHSNANNKYTENYDSNKESVLIIYLDANNLYGWAMTQYSPYSGFKWLNLREISDLCLDSMSENSSIGYIVEVVLEYPSELHDLHNDYPLAPKKLEINQDMLSKYWSDIGNNHAFQLYLPLGMKVSKVHRILKFKQSYLLKKFVDFNTDKRKNASKSFEKDFF